MRFSRALIPTVKEAPADATSVSHILLTRGGFVRRVGAGIYEYLPLGTRVLHKVEALVRREMDRAGALEVLMPALLPADYFKESGRWDRFGDSLFRLKDRKGGDYHLGPTHEEIVTDIARHEVKSYRDLPKNLYQIQNKFRDEPRPRGGLLRCREFIMKDAYSFDVDEAGAARSYDEMRKAYVRIFDALGLTYRLVAADSGAMGGNTSAEFQVLVESGEDAIVACGACDYAANVEVATVRADGTSAADGTSPDLPVLGQDQRPQRGQHLEEAAPAAHAAKQAEPALAKVHTPGHGGIDDVAKFLGVAPKDMLKSLLYVAGESLALTVVRGDHEVNEVRLARALGVPEVFLASEAEVKKATGAAVGFAGPVGFRGRVVVDRAASLVLSGVTGANETDYHLTGVVRGRDYEGEIVDVRLAVTGDTCPQCGVGKLTSYRGIEAGHIFILGTHYTEKMGASFLDESQQKRAMVMGCYGIGVSRLVATTVEQNHDADGILWPMTIAPYQVHLCTLGKDAPLLEAAGRLYDELWGRGIEVLWDDRDERPGVKFKDADLIGVPLRVTFGGKSFAAGTVEVKARTERDPKKAEAVPLAVAVERIAAMVGGGT
jgi:prolyl-tRNA synthetase